MKNTGIEHSVESVYFPRVRLSILSPSLRQTPFSDPGTTLLRFCDEVEQKKPGPEGGKKKVHYSRPSKSPKAISVLMPKELCLALGPVGLLSPSEGGLTTPTPHRQKAYPWLPVGDSALLREEPACRVGRPVLHCVDRRLAPE